MNNRWKFAATLTLSLLVCAAALILQQNVSAAGEGKITGTIKLDGTPPHQKPIDMSKEPSCQQQHAGHPITTETVVTGPNGALQFVVVYISEGLSGAAANAVPSQTPDFNQKGCQYIPHVVGLQVNQPMEIFNHDQTSHNIHPMSKTNPEWNKMQAQGAPPIEDRFKRPETLIPVKCNQHGWMKANVGVLAHPYFARRGPRSTGREEFVACLPQESLCWVPSPASPPAPRARRRPPGPRPRPRSNRAAGRT